MQHRPGPLSHDSARATASSSRSTVTILRRGCTWLRIGSFPIIDPYPEDGGALLAQSTNDAIEFVVDKSDSDDFEIDSDVSDKDLLLLKAEIKRAESTKI